MIDRSVIALASVLALAAPAAAQTSDISGKWDVTVIRAQGVQTAPLLLKRDGDKIVGTLTTPQGDVVPVEAVVKEKAVTISFTVPTQNGPLSLTMKGAVDGDTMTGTMDIGGNDSAPWSAKRAAGSPAAPATAQTKLDVSGTWAFSVESAAGTGTPTMIFKQDGEKLTGSYSGQLGEAALTGTLKGTAIEFSIDLSLQGTPLHIVYAGTADATSMKGTAAFGDLGNGTFTAKKTK